MKLMHKYQLLGDWEANRNRDTIGLWETNMRRLMFKADELRLSKGLPPWKLTSEVVLGTPAPEIVRENIRPYDDSGAQWPFDLTPCPITLNGVPLADLLTIKVV